MFSNLSLLAKLSIFILGNFLLGTILFDNEIIVGGWPVFFFPFIYGFFIGVLIEKNQKNSWGHIFLIGLIFLLIFLISSFGTVFLSSKVFLTDDYVPLLSTPLSVFLIILLVSRYVEIPNAIEMGTLMIVLGVAATYLGDYLAKSEANSSYLNIPILWQLATGIPMIIFIKKKSNH